MDWEIWYVSISILKKVIDKTKSRLTPDKNLSISEFVQYGDKYYGLIAYI